LALVITFGNRGLYFRGDLTNKATWIPIWFDTLVMETRMFVFLGLFPFFINAIRKRDWSLIFFSMPAVFLYIMHAGATHYITRYNDPLIPVVIICFVLTIRG